MHVRVGKLLLIQLVHFRTNGSIRSTSSNTFTSKDVATLGCSSWLSSSIKTSLVHFLYHLDLIRSKHVLSASSKAITVSVLARRDNFTLRRRYFIIILIWHILLNRSQHWHVVLILLTCNSWWPFHEIDSGCSSHFHTSSHFIILSIMWHFWKLLSVLSLVLCEGTANEISLIHILKWNLIDVLVWSCSCIT